MQHLNLFEHNATLNLLEITLPSFSLHSFICSFLNTWTGEYALSHLVHRVIAGKNPRYCLRVQNPHSIKYNGTVQGLKYIWRTEGLRGLFKGNGTHCARIVPNSTVKFFSYEQASKYHLIFLIIQVVLVKWGILWFYQQQTGNGAMMERDTYLGRILTGRIASGVLRVGDRVHGLRSTDVGMQKIEDGKVIVCGIH